MRDSGIDSEAETDVFHARVINACGEDADEDFVKHMSECVFVYSVFKVHDDCKLQIQDSSFRHKLYSFRYSSGR